MSVRERYKFSAIADDIRAFDKIIEARDFEGALEFWRENLEKPTLFGLETSLCRAELLRKIEVGGLSKGEDKAFVLYALALTLNLTGGYPNRAIPLYEKHKAICEKIGDDKSLSASLGHYAKALRQVGRFRESEEIAFYGLKIIRERGDFLREAVNLYWLGMGLAHRGEAEKSETALQRSLRIFKAKFETQAEGVVNAFLAQRALWLGFYDEALICATRAEEIGKALEMNENHADLHGAIKILTAALRMKGEALTFLQNTESGEEFLLKALKKAREIEFVEEELPALRALARLEKERENFEPARDYLKQSRHLGKRGNFALYNADALNIWASIEVAQSHKQKAIETAEQAFRLSICDGEPFTYQRGILDAQHILQNLRTTLPVVPAYKERNLLPVPEIEINPKDEFAG